MISKEEQRSSVRDLVRKFDESKGGRKTTDGILLIGRGERTDELYVCLYVCDKR